MKSSIYLGFGLAIIVAASSAEQGIEGAQPAGVSATDIPEAGGTPEAGGFDPTDRYDDEEIEGWRVRVNRGLREADAELSQQVLSLLRHQLYQIVRKAPAKALEKLRKIPIWVELREPHHPCMCYHVDAGWLRDHDMNPEKAGGVEIANSRNFLIWTLDQPWMVLHELAHGYHHRFLADGYDHSGLLEAYHAAVDAGTYDAVLRLSGARERAYAATNQMEYFAELSEAFFGTNDFFPYVRSELAEHDPRAFKLLAELWHVNDDGGDGSK